MKKVPTLFKREFIEVTSKWDRIVKIHNEVTPGLEWVLEGEGVATVKWDGSCCAIFDGVFYKRYDAKGGKPVPKGAIPCQPEADPVTGHWPCWMPCDRENSSDKWFWAAYDRAGELPDGTYEAVGKHFLTNPYHLKDDRLIPHGKDVVEVERTFEGIREYLRTHDIEGLVFWRDGEPKCKIKKRDFGFRWK